MFSALVNLAKAAVSVALAPAAIVVDAVTVVVSSVDGKEPPSASNALLKNAGACVAQAVKPVKDPK